MKSRKKLSKILIAAMVCMSVSSLGMMVAEGAGNIKDTYFDFNYYDQQGRPVAVGSRPKLDYTSCYVYNINSYQAIKVDVWATDNTTSNYRSIENCNASGTKIVNKGQSMYLPNYVKERKYNSCTLQVTPHGNIKTYIHGCWSPDSV